MIYSLLVLDRVKRAHDVEIEKRGKAAAERIGEQAKFPLRTGDEDALDKLAKDALSGDDILAVTIKPTNNGQTINARKNGPLKGRSRRFSYSVKIKPGAFADEIDILQGVPRETDEVVIGEVGVLMSLSQTDLIVKEIRAAMIVTAIVLVTLAILINIHIARRITDPLMTLAREVEKIGKGKFDARIEDMGGGEIGVVAEHFNRMAQNLEGSIARMIQQEKMASLGRMASGITHEIGNPLNSILLYCKILLDQANEGEEAENVKAILAQARRMKEIVNHLLDYAHKPPTQMQAVEISRALDESLRVLTHPVAKSKLSIKCDIPTDLPKAKAIMNMCVQVFVNIISNAIEATGKNGELEIEAWAGEERSCLYVAFADNGPGIPDELLESVFEPFFTSGKEAKGTGLGLSICQQIMRGFDGEISAESAGGGGAKIIIKFQCVTPKDVV